MRLQLPRIVDFERSYFKLYLRLALEGVTPLLCPVLSADGHGQLHLHRDLAVIGNLGDKLVLLWVQAHRVVAYQWMHFVVLDVFVLMLVELGDVLRRHLQADSLKDCQAEADGRASLLLLRAVWQRFLIRGERIVEVRLLVEVFAGNRQRDRCGGRPHAAALGSPRKAGQAKEGLGGSIPNCQSLGQR